MDDQQKREAINAKRGPLDHELYSAELDLRTAEAHGAPELMQEPKERVERIKRQLAVLDKEAAQLD